MMTKERLKSLWQLRAEASEQSLAVLRGRFKEIGEIAGDCRRSLLTEGSELPGVFWIEHFAQIERLAAAAGAAANPWAQVGQAAQK